jgi:hypothetical protein
MAKMLGICHFRKIITIGLSKQAIKKARSIGRMIILRFIKIKATIKKRPKPKKSSSDVRFPDSEFLLRSVIDILSLAFIKLPIIVFLF